MPRKLTVQCFCGRLVTVRQRRQGPGLLAALGAVCDCGRGIDLAIEREPASEPAFAESACLARFSDVFLRAFEQRLSSRRRKAKHAVRPPPKEPYQAVSQPWPPPMTGPSPLPPQTQFPSREEWLAWCERDRQAEEQELMDLYLQHDLQILPRTG